MSAMEATWLVWILLSAAASRPAEPATDSVVVEKFATLALECIHKEYPNKVSHTLSSDADVRPPRELTPVFFGCFDWHSAVHGHWLLVRLARLRPRASLSPRARAALSISFTADRVAGERRYLAATNRQEFERPYGLAWLLQLCAELREWKDVDAQRWTRTLEPLEHEAVARLKNWLPKLTRAIRTGEHSQTAFAFGLILDWARIAGDREMEALVSDRSRDFHAGDIGCPLSYEPSGQDFLSPCLAEADLMRRVLPSGEFVRWFDRFLTVPSVPSESWLPIGVVTDPSDGKLAHLDGLNLSRAWMLEGILSALPAEDPRRATLESAMRTHAESGLKSVANAHYMGGHWLGTFATYLATRRGLTVR
jgi:Protein of unknown function (DUF2891)